MLKNIFIIQIAIICFVGACWVVNIVKLCKSDFDFPVKREIIHGVGIVPGVSVVTCWFNIEE